ncbi:hypothetical protein [Methylobacterium sp. 77]|uniref:hypothetical protein n=1 Tax=Methylobacterium sp. 77 TaxID=1101192 RepID=UPI0003A4F0D0|nr:hypothetical protein [Methylobacterium sp. 77]
MSAVLFLGLSACVTLCPEPSAASPLAGRGVLDDIPAPVLEFTLPCDRLDGCSHPGASQQPDRRVHPFEGTLGRPCGYRWRPTPSGTRKVRVCY